ncbi:MAG: uncharacterized protein QOE77_350 [Blastocatellia bacterium]|nr:uncharacterized protein [Blastocatellia bacterium]
MLAMVSRAPKASDLIKPVIRIAGWAALFLTLTLSGWLYRRLPLPAVQRSQAAPLSKTNHPTPKAKRPAAGETAAAYWSDNDSDGIPDGGELRSFQDRESFRRWFTAIAEMQFYRFSESWNPQQRDCAGLVRFAWREALRQHNAMWFRKMGPEYETVASDVSDLQLDQNPLGEKLFRTDFGSFQRVDLAEGKFAEFADARSLKTFNATFISRDRRQAQSGDLIFFYQPQARKLPYHVMLFLGQARTAPNGADDWVVYHTGGSPDENGTVKKVELSVLDGHPDPRWRPIASNRNFLGFYRLKILD